jgi:Semialdehyde dehydrogenase, NAD binding domain
MEAKLKNDPVVAIAGATGAVGAEFIATMDKRAFRVGKLKALASARSAGKTIDFRGRMDPKMPLVIPRSTPTASPSTTVSSPFRITRRSRRWCRCGRSTGPTASSA